MASFPMMSTVHHCRKHRQSVEKVRMNDVVTEPNQSARLVIPDIPAVSLMAQSTASSGLQTPAFLKNSTVTNPVANIAVVTLKPVCKPIIGVLRKDSFISNVSFIFPSKN